MSNISIIGSGNVAWALAQRLHEKNCKIHQVCARDPELGQELSKAVDSEYVKETGLLDPEVGIIIIAVSDDAIREVAKDIPNTKALVIHCSGSTPLAALPQKNRAVIWPLRSIARGQEMTWSDMNLVLEADTDIASIKALDLAQTLGSKAVKMDSKERKTAHLVAVILNNFSNHLLHMSDVLCAEQGMDRRIFQDLMEHTLHYSGKAIDSQTGPAARKDKEVMQRQMNLLNDHPHFQEVYRVISNSIMTEDNDDEL